MPRIPSEVKAEQKNGNGSVAREPYRFLPEYSSAQETRKRREQLALNLFDLDNIPAHLRQMLLAGKLDKSGTVKADQNRPDEVGVMLAGDLLTAACVCDVIRAANRRAGDPPCRVYLKRRDAWTRIADDAMLTLSENGYPVLNPELFPPEKVSVPAPPPAEESVRPLRGLLGRKKEK